MKRIVGKNLRDVEGERGSFYAIVLCWEEGGYIGTALK